MKLAIFGTKKEALYLMKQILFNGMCDLIAFVDNDINKQGKSIEGYPVISCQELVKKYGEEVDTVIIAVRGAYSRLSILHQLKNKGINKIGFFRVSYSDYKKKIIDIEDAIIWIEKTNLPIMPYLECNIVDSCNLKCKGCTHFSNLFDENIFVDYESLLDDLKQISQKVYIAELRLLGGEPLLHPELEKIIESVRKILPFTDINVVTNGLLITKVSENLFDIMRKSDIGFHISRYIPTNHQMENIVRRLEKENVNFFIEDATITQFGKTLDMKGKSNAKKAQEACISLGCRFLRNRKMYKCPFEGLIDIFADIYGYKQIPENRGFDIYDENINWERKLEEYFLRPVEMCKYCAEKCELFDWEIKTKPQKEDWIIES